MRKGGSGILRIPRRLIVERKALWHRAQTQRMRDKLFTQTECCLTIILRDKLHDLFEVSDGAVGDQDFDSESFRELKSIAESCSSLPRRGAPGRLRHPSSRVPRPLPVRLHRARHSSRTIRQQATLCRASSNARLPFLFPAGYIPSPVPIIAFAVPMLKP